MYRKKKKIFPYLAYIEKYRTTKSEKKKLLTHKWNKSSLSPPLFLLFVSFVGWKEEFWLDHQSSCNRVKACKGDTAMTNPPKCGTDIPWRVDSGQKVCAPIRHRCRHTSGTHAPEHFDRNFEKISDARLVCLMGAHTCEGSGMLKNEKYRQFPF